MTTPGNGGPASTPTSPSQEGQPQQTQPQLNVLGQYIKDFSFENPNAPRSLLGGGVGVIIPWIKSQRYE